MPDYCKKTKRRRRESIVEKEWRVIKNPEGVKQKSLRPGETERRDDFDLSLFLSLT